MKLLINLSEKDKKELLDTYLEGFSCEELALKYKYSTRQIQRYLKHIGFIRTRRESYKLAIKRGRMTYHHLRVDNKTSDIRKTINPTQRYRILKRNDFKCISCGLGVKQNAVLQVDHIVELCRGGGNDDSNLQTLCIDCNIGKYHQNSINKGKIKPTREV